MHKSSMKVSDEARLTVYFEEPFWVGVFERRISGKLSVNKVIFGAEPTDTEVFAFILKHYYSLQFSKSVKINHKQKPDNPKRRQREAKKQMQKIGIGTKSQQALKKQHEENKLERKRYSKVQNEEEKKHQFELKQQKRKEKHKGH